MIKLSKLVARFGNLILSNMYLNSVGNANDIPDHLFCSVGRLSLPVTAQFS